MIPPLQTEDKVQRNADFVFFVEKSNEGKIEIR